MSDQKDIHIIINGHYNTSHIHTYIHTLYIYAYIHKYIHALVSNYYQILKRANEGVAGTNGANCSTEGACDLHHPMWIKS